MFLQRLVALLSESHRLVERHQEKATHELQVSAELREELASLDNARAELENAQKQNHNAAEQLTCKVGEQTIDRFTRCSMEIPSEAEGGKFGLGKKVDLTTSTQYGNMAACTDTYIYSCGQ